MTGTGKKSGEQSPPRGSKKKEPKPFTLETLQECAKRVGAPPLGDTPSARRVVDDILYFTDPARLAFKKRARASRGKVRRIVEQFEELLGAFTRYSDFKKDQATTNGAWSGGIEKLAKEAAKLQALSKALSEAKDLIHRPVRGPVGAHLVDGRLTKKDAYSLFLRLRAAWKENGQKPPSAAKTYKTIGKALVKVGIEVSDSAIRDAVKAAEKLEKSRRKTAE